MYELLLILALIVGAMLLILAEICTPTFGTLALAAVICLGIVIYKCFVISPVLGLAAMILILIGVPLYLRCLVGLFPKTPLGKRLMLRRLKADTGGGVPEASEHESLIGAEGVATTTLRPSGTVTINGRRRVATAESGFIAGHTPVRVVRSSGLNLVVRAINQVSQGQQ